jgi:hypothetical protein
METRLTSPFPRPSKYSRYPERIVCWERIEPSGLTPIQQAREHNGALEGD